MFKVRAYKSSDYQDVYTWVNFYEGVVIPKDMLLENGTFILELNNVPALCVTVLLTQTKEMAYMFNFLKNPIFEDISLEEYGKMLWNHCYKWAAEQGYKRLICFTDSEKLKAKYERFGMTPTLSNLTSLKIEI